MMMMMICLNYNQRLALLLNLLWRVLSILTNPYQALNLCVMALLLKIYIYIGTNTQNLKKGLLHVCKRYLGNAFYANSIGASLTYQMKMAIPRMTIQRDVNQCYVCYGDKRHRWSKKQFNGVKHI